MRRVQRKQDRNDFNARIQRLDPAFASTPVKARETSKPWVMGTKRSNTSGSPVLMTGMGFALAVTALFAANNPETVQSILIQTGWPLQYLHIATNGISILLIGLILFYLANIIRIVNPRATGRRNAAGLVFGAIAAIGVTSLDTTHIDAGLKYAGIANTEEFLTIAQTQTAGLVNIDWTSVVTVSSSAK
jgi:hypothetical protein